MLSSVHEHAIVIPFPGAAMRELYSRALCLDSDPAWFVHRRNGITATDAKVIARGRAATVDKHLREKAAATDADWKGNKNTDFGRWREARILRDDVGAGWVPCGVLFHAKDALREMATPDRIRLSFLGEVELGEHKSSNKPIPLGSPEYRATRYWEQKLWQMHVTGAARIVFSVDIHDDDWSRWDDRPRDGWTAPDGTDWDDYGPKVIDTYEVTIERSPEVEAEIAELVKKVRAALVSYDQILGVLPTEVGPQLDAEGWGRVAKLAAENVDGLDAEKAGKLAKDNSRAALVEFLADGDLPGFTEVLGGVQVTYSPELPAPPVDVLDSEAMLADPRHDEIEGAHAEAAVVVEAVNERFREEQVKAEAVLADIAARRAQAMEGPAHAYEEARARLRELAAEHTRPMPSGQMEKATLNINRSRKEDTREFAVVANPAEPEGGTE